MTQRDKMRELIRLYISNKQKIILEYAKTEKHGEVSRRKNVYNYSPEKYAVLLYKNAIARGWYKTGIPPKKRKLILFPGDWFGKTGRATILAT